MTDKKNFRKPFPKDEAEGGREQQEEEQKNKNNENENGNGKQKQGDERRDSETGREGRAIRPFVSFSLFFLGPSYVPLF